MLEALIALPFLLGLVCFIASSLEAREIGIAAVRRICAQEDLQLLDESVAQSGIRLVRKENGRLAFERTFTFEYSETGDNRRPGFVVLRGREIIMIQAASRRDQAQIG